MLPYIAAPWILWILWEWIFIRLIPIPRFPGAAFASRSGSLEQRVARCEQRCHWGRHGGTVRGFKVLSEKSGVIRCNTSHL